MKLSELIVDGLHCLRDGEFHALGFSSDARPGLLTFAETAEFLAALDGKRTIAAVITTPELHHAVPRSLAVAVHPSPRLAFYESHSWLARHTDFYTLAIQGSVAASAR